MTNTDVREHPEYAEGFREASDDVPLDEDFHSPEYAAGWRAWHEAMAILKTLPQIFRGPIEEILCSEDAELSDN